MTDPLCLLFQALIMLQPNVQQITLNQLSPLTPSELGTPITPSPTSTASFHTATVATPKTLGRVMSEEGDRSHYGAMIPDVLPFALPGYQHSMSSLDPLQELNPDPAQAALLQSARLQLSSKDQEAMRKIRSTMMDHNFSDPESSNSVSPSSPGFPGASAAGPSKGQGLSTRRSTLSKVVMGESQGDKGENEDTERLETSIKRWQSQPALLREGRCITNFRNTPAGSVDYAIAVVGHEGVGKTTVIAEALRGWGMSNPVKMYSPDGHIPKGGKLKTGCKVKFFEMGINALDFTPRAASIWPSSAQHVSGAICCYDAGREETLEGIKDCIERLSAISTPTIILACKSDPNTELRVTAAHGNSIGEPYNVGLIEGTTKTYEGKLKVRNAVRWLLISLKSGNKELSALNIGRSLVSGVQAPTSVGSNAITTSTTSTIGSLASPDSGVDSMGNRLMRKQTLSMTSYISESALTSQGSRGVEGILEDQKFALYDAEKLAEPDKKKNMNDGSQGCLDNSEESTGPEERQTGPVQAKCDTIVDPVAHGISAVYVALKDLLNRLFTAIVSSQDNAFTKSFFLTYRRFCHPQDLMLEFLQRFHEVEHYAVSSDVKNWALLKLTGALVNWTSRYPGDCVSMSTPIIFGEIIALLFKYTFMAHLISDLISIQNGLLKATDPEESWSMLSHDVTSHSVEDGAGVLIHNERVRKLDDNEGGDEMDSIERKAASNLSASTDTVQLEGVKHRQSESDSRRIEILSGISTVGKDGSLSGSQHSHTRSGGASYRMNGMQISNEVAEAKWGTALNMVMRMEPKVFAAELTRMQWELFLGIRPRDVFRHALGKEIGGPVGKSIDFFNHLSRWISTIVLASSKAKHRARVIERCILIAHQHRRLNNYDSLYAVISGLREASVHREDIFSTAKQADIHNRRGAIPLLNNILGLVSQLQAVRPNDYREEDGKVQWDKFMRFGEILSIIQECQARGPVVNGNVDLGFKKIIEETTILSDKDALWERSQSLENSRGTMGGKMRKRFANLGF
ncbi:hypothetical protein D1P53_005902 [Cryptococcus gattii VGV]|nr:hypothetical protein D1P53_005902 [Cryptococcus gattii VGV]